MAKADILVSVIGIVRNDADVLPAFVAEASQVLEAAYADYEIVLVDNGSDDRTPEVVDELLRRFRCIRYLRLTRVADDETAVTAGLDAAIGDFTVIMHPDFDPTDAIVPMVEECRGGVDVVLGVLRHPTESDRLYDALRRSFFALTRRMLKVDLIADTTGLRVLSRHAVNSLITVRRRRRYFAVVAADVGLTIAVFPCDRISRSGRRPTRSLLRALRTASSVLIQNSVTPLRIAAGLGLFGSFLGFLYTLYALVIYLFKSDVVPGWTTLSLAVSVLFSLCFLMLALIGEYLGRVLDEASDRPLYHLRPEKSSAVMLTQPERRNVIDRSVDDSAAAPADPNA